MYSGQLEKVVQPVHHFLLKVTLRLGGTQTAEKVYFKMVRLLYITVCLLNVGYI